MKWVLLIVALIAGTLSLKAQAQSDSSYLVLGAIGSGDSSEGVVLLKKRVSDAAFAVKVGAEVEPGVIVFKLSDRYVYFNRGRDMLRVKVGEELERSHQAVAVLPKKREIEVRGDKVTLTSRYKEHMVKNELPKILMQAAAVPHYENGSLEGFKLVEIDSDSIYDQIGLLDGDIVTEINGQKLSDVGMAVKVLNSMRNETRAEIRLLRAGAEKTIEINVQ